MFQKGSRSSAIITERRRRSARAAKRWQKRFEEQKRIHKEIQEAASDILKSRNFRSTRRHIQHGSMTVNSHCMSVARHSVALSYKLEKLHIRSNRRELIRGALLHDYFLYDWHDADHISPHKLHGFYHPGVAVSNASREYNLTDREKDIIRKHMWPLTIVPPLCREGWIVTASDKWCSLLETLHFHKGHGAVIEAAIEDETEKHNIG